MDGRYRYTFKALQERLGITAEDLTAYMELGLLLPDKWTDFSEAERASYIKDDFRFASWTAETVDRFAAVTDLFRKNYQLFYQRVGMRLDAIDDKADGGFKTLFAYSRKILSELADLKWHVDKRGSWIDSAYFCAETGYKISSFHNQMRSDNARDIETGHVFLGNYKSLEWKRLRGEKKWRCRLADFENLRAGFSYDMRLEEKKRKGEFKAPIKIRISDIV